MDKKKRLNKIKYGVVSCIVALSMIICVNAPISFYATTSEYLGGFNSGINTTYAFSPTSIGCINNSVVVYDDYYAGGTLYTQYTVFDAFVTIASVKCNNVYSAMRTYVSSFNFVPTSYSNMNGFQLAIGTWEEFQNGEYHTILAAGGGIAEMHITGWDELSIYNYGTGEEVYIGLVFNCYCPSTPGSISSVAATCSFSFSGTIELYGYDIVGTSELIYRELTEMYAQNEDIIEDLNNIWYKQQIAEARLNTLVEYIQKNYERLATIDANIIQLTKQIGLIIDSLDSIEEELTTQTSWLDKIWQSLQELLNLNSEKQEEQEQVNNSANNSIGQLGDLSNDLNFDKPDINDINVNVNTYIPQEYIDDYSTLLKVFTNHTVIKDMLLVAFTICVISYTMFGKRR